MKVTQIFEFTEEEMEHITFVVKLLRKMDGDENIKERLSDYYLCDNVADYLEEILECVKGTHYYTLDVPER
jgi:hypothetical protein